jgi:uncharacterized protein (DUF488 family)
MAEPGTIWTLGHSDRTLGELIDLLTAESIPLVADVRRFPGSRRQPQFSKETFEQALHAAGIAYRHFEALGGRRRLKHEAAGGTAWRSKSFHAYADYMRTAEFQAALEQLMELARSARTVVLCAEAVPWRCHRQLIADALAARGWEVRHILGPRQVRQHRLTEFARVSAGEVTYPGSEEH